MVSRGDRVHPHQWLTAFHRLGRGRRDGSFKRSFLDLCESNARGARQRSQIQGKCKSFEPKVLIGDNKILITMPGLEEGIF